MSNVNLSRSVGTIHATPTTTLVDDTIFIKLRGFEPGSKLTVRSHLPEPRMCFEAHGHYLANSAGEVSVAEEPSVGGTYTGIEPMGLIWSMKQSPGQKLGRRFMKRDVTTPMAITLSAHNGHIDMSELQTNIPVCETGIRRTYMAENVETIKVHSGRIRGRVYKPKGTGPFRGVLDLYVLVGGINVYRAALLASRGFAVYALPYLKYADLPVPHEELELDYFEEATDWLLEQTYVRPGGVGVCGVSWGAEFATQMATQFPEKISACVGISGGSMRTTFTTSYKGKDLPCLSFDLARVKTVQEAYGNSPRIINVYDVLDHIETAPEGALIQMEKANRLLLFVGMDDKMYPNLQFLDKAEERLTLECSNYEIVRYSKTGHIIDPPHAPVTLASYHPFLGSVVEYGGEAREHQRAHEDSWQRILDFFNKYVRPSQSK